METFSRREKQASPARPGSLAADQASGTGDRAVPERATRGPGMVRTRSTRVGQRMFRLAAGKLRMSAGGRERGAVNEIA